MAIAPQPQKKIKEPNFYNGITHFNFKHFKLILNISKTSVFSYYTNHPYKTCEIQTGKKK